MITLFESKFATIRMRPWLRRSLPTLLLANPTQSPWIPFHPKIWPRDPITRSTGIFGTTLVKILFLLLINFKQLTFVDDVSSFRNWRFTLSIKSYKRRIYSETLGVRSRWNPWLEDSVRRGETADFRQQKPLDFRTNWQGHLQTVSFR